MNSQIKHIPHPTSHITSNDSRFEIKSKTVISLTNQNLHYVLHYVARLLTILRFFWMAIEKLGECFLLNPSVPSQREGHTDSGHGGWMITEKCSSFLENILVDIGNTRDCLLLLKDTSVPVKQKNNKKREKHKIPLRKQPLGHSEGDSRGDWVNRWPERKVRQQAEQLGIGWISAVVINTSSRGQTCLMPSGTSGGICVRGRAQHISVRSDWHYPLLSSWVPFIFPRRLLGVDSKWPDSTALPLWGWWPCLLWSGSAGCLRWEGGSWDFWPAPPLQFDKEHLSFLDGGGAVWLLLSHIQNHHAWDTKHGKLFILIKVQRLHSMGSD